MEDTKANFASHNVNLGSLDSKNDEMKEISQKDNFNNEMEELINKNENYIFCHKCGEKLKIEKINDLILNNNNKMKDIINGIVIQLEANTKNDSINSLNIQIKNIREDLLMLINYINKNNGIIFNLLNDKHHKINNNKTMVSNDLNNKKGIKILSDNKSNEISHNKEHNSLLNAIKSQYIMKIIFSYLNEKDKLNMIKYNKNLQNKISINLINYKLLSGIYIKYESEVEVKEYYGDTGNLRFEGEYLNGKRNGKGKEYYENGYLMFEGEYLNGKRNGNGKEYYYFNDEFYDELDDIYDLNKIMFDGEYLNGIRWNGKIYDKDNKNFFELRNGTGYIKDYNSNGTLIFEGEYLNGKRNGKGKEYNNNGNLEFEGEYLNDKKWNGKGYNDQNNFVYELKNGNGKVKEFYINDEIKFEGEYINGVKNGKGKEYYKNGELIYEGEYLNDKKNGKGKEYQEKNKLEYEGEYLNDERNGKGKEYYENGKLKYEGIYLYNFKLNGKEYYNDGKLEFEGDYLYGKKWNGKGYDKNGNIIYVLNNGNGKVKEYDYRGILKFDGEYLNGKKSGKGKEYNGNNIIYYYGEYLEGQRWNGLGKDFLFNYNEYSESTDIYLVEYEYINGEKFGFKTKIISKYI